MQSDIKLAEHTIEILGDKVSTQVGYGGGTIELTGSNLKTAVSDIDMLFYGGRLRAQGGQIELGSSDSGTFQGYQQGRNGQLQLTGGQCVISASSVEIGPRSGDSPRGLSVSSAGVRCHTGTLSLLNPATARDSQPRHALAHSSADELILNAQGHYQGGVKVDGPLSIQGDARVNATLSMALGSKLLFATPDKVVTLPQGKTVKMPGTPLDVRQVIEQLQETVKQLQARVAALEAR